MDTYKCHDNNVIISSPISRSVCNFYCKCIYMYVHSQMLQKLLASKNPDDLRAANRLIREMVRRDDKRMQKLQKRLDELELVQNNVKLLSELLSHYKPEAGEQERLLIDVSPYLYRVGSMRISHPETDFPSLKFLWCTWRIYIILAHDWN